MVHHRHVVWLDVDDVLVDFCGMYNAHISAMGHGPLAKEYVPLNWNYTEVLGTEKRSREIFSSLPADWPRLLEPHRAAVAFTWRLHDAGARVILVTSLEQKFATHRLANLTANGFYFDEIYFSSRGTSQEKADYIEALMGRYGAAKHIFLDDYGKNCVSVSSALGQLVDVRTFERPYNDQYKPQFGKLGVAVSATRENLFDSVIEIVEKGACKC